MKMIKFGVSCVGFTALSMAMVACSKTPEVTPSDVASRVAEQTVLAKAVMIHADWCSSCKVLQPKVDAVRGGYEAQGLKFVTLDYTSKDKMELFDQARKAGVFEATVKALGDHVKTGQLIFVSADGTQVLSKVNMTHTEEEIARSMNAAIGG